VFVKPSAGQSELILEQLSEDRFARLQQELRGAVVFRDEIVGIEPEVEFWIDLSTRRGTAADRAFFKQWKDVFGDGLWPSYISPQTDYSGCTVFGNGSLTGTYAGWTSYERNYPGRYAKAVQGEIEQAARELTMSTCACSTKEEVAREFALFLRRFPRSSIAPEVRRRSQALATRPAAFRFRCVSG